MNFKKNFKRFFTLSRNAEGFTLVELIVVIAILGILSVVAVPAYTKYVDAAGKAVDKQNLSVMNSAFAVACAVNGVDAASGVSDAVVVGSGKTVTGVDVTLVSKTRTVTEETTDTAAKIEEFFAESLNGGLTFKTIEYTAIDFANGTFFAEGLGDGSTDGDSGVTITPDENGNYVLDYGSKGGKITLSAEDLSKLEDSTFIKSEGLGTQGLLNKVDEVTNFAAALSGTNIMLDILQDPDFQQTAATAVGCTLAELPGKVDEMAAAMMKLPGNENMTMDQAVAQVQANAAVLFASQKAAAMTKDQITSNLTAEGAGSNLVATLTKDPSGTMANAALAYGMYTAYAYQSGDATKIANTKDYTNMGTYLEDPAFKAYVSSAQGQKDLDAYLSSLNMINASTGDKNAVTDLMVNGFNDPALIDVINKAMGAN